MVAFSTFLTNNLQEQQHVPAYVKAPDLETLGRCDGNSGANAYLAACAALDDLNGARKIESRRIKSGHQ